MNLAQRLILRVAAESFRGTAYTRALIDWAWVAGRHMGVELSDATYRKAIADLVKAGCLEDKGRRSARHGRLLGLTDAGYEALSLFQPGEEAAHV